jgi:hypothetical protein
MARVYSRARGRGCDSGFRFLWTGRRSEGVARVVLAPSFFCCRSSVRCSIQFDKLRVSPDQRESSDAVLAGYAGKSRVCTV